MTRGAGVVMGRSEGGWRRVRLGALVRVCDRGWEWWEDPRRGGGLCLRSPRGGLWDFRRGWVRRREKNDYGQRGEG